jgi:hypothetical protein
MRKRAAVLLVFVASFVIASGIAIVAWVRVDGDEVGDAQAALLAADEAAKIRMQIRERRRERKKELIEEAWREQEGPIDGGDPDRIPARDYLVGTWTYRFPDSMYSDESKATFGADGSFRRGQHAAGHYGTWTVDGRRITIAITSASGYYYTGPQEWTEELVIRSVSKDQILLWRDDISRSFMYQRHDAAAANPGVERASDD